ncbi:hypothetical protein JQ824_01200 [Brachyspira hyodysenteriae]|nr:hypothetical protein [Brachyspira hyodysenteriae]
MFLIFGLAWLGLAWLGLAWLGLAWLGLACYRYKIYFTVYIFHNIY